MAHDLSAQILTIWAVPRSTSTAFAKAISGAPDVRVLHEPFTDCYYFGPQRRSRRYGDSPVVADFDAAAAQELILSAAGNTDRLFVKELAFQAYHYLQDDLLLKLKSTLLIRHPLHVIASLMRLKPDFTEEELGFQALYSLCQRITDLQGTMPMIIDGDQFRRYPRQTLLYFCASNRLPFSDAMLHWGSGNLRLWLPHERESQQKWHATLESSTTILPPAGYPAAPDLSGQQLAMLQRAMEIYGELAASALDHRSSQSAQDPPGATLSPGQQTWMEPSIRQPLGPGEEPRR